MIKTRKLTIYTKFRQNGRDYTTIPEIRLEGKWLEKLGFMQGQKVKVEQEEFKLTITVDDEIKE
jgi:toxic protein SymE